MPDNNQFLQAIFKEDAPFVHVTDFSHDPGKIPTDQHLIAWKGDWFSRYRMGSDTNQYFTISIFAPDEEGKARRRKALFLRTRVIVLDDVREKLSMDAVNRMPQPSYILETSPGSEQWGYILSQPCSDRARVENLLDGLVANGLAPDGRDPGMKGATRYVRLPDGYNMKESKFVDGLPFRCKLLAWNPERTVTMEELASPFHVDLDRVRREARVDGAAAIPDHPLLQIPEIIKIKELRSDGRFDITCPWVDEHTGQDDSGSAIFTNDDGSIGFHCHHGGCQERSARDLMRYVEAKLPGFGMRLADWRAGRIFSGVANMPMVAAPMAPVQATSTEVVSFIDQPAETVAVAPPPPSLDGLIDALSRERHTSPEARALASTILRIAEDMNGLEKQNIHSEVCRLMVWSKLDFRPILKELREEWYQNSSRDVTFMNNFVFIKEQNRFYDYGSRIFYTPEAFQNSYSDKDADVRKNALEGGKVDKVDRLDFAPRQPRIFTEKGITYGNAWCAQHAETGEPGDVTMWLEHWDRMGWTEHREHHLKWMAFTLRHPESKINHMLILGGKEGTGKDFLIYPLVRALGEYAKTIEGNELTSNHNEYLLNTKLLIINETEMGDHAQAREVSNKLKPLAAAPPTTLRVNPKGITALNIRNIVNGIMTTNDKMPLRLNGPSRRFHALWTHLNTRDIHENLLPEWVVYWKEKWGWMDNGGGYLNCINYLLTQVDISDFNPGVAPPMTDFLREIQQASKSPAQVTLESFIHHKIGSMRSDLVTVADVTNTLRSAGMLNSDLMNVDPNWFSPTRVGRLLGEVSQCQQLRITLDGKSVQLWIVRNAELYNGKDPKDMTDLYHAEMEKLRTSSVEVGSHIRLASVTK